MNSITYLEGFALRLAAATDDDVRELLVLLGATLLERNADAYNYVQRAVYSLRAARVERFSEAAE